MPDSNKDTIVALSTPPGKSGLAVVRLSGPNSVQIVNKLFTSSVNISADSHGNALVGDIVDPASGETLDEVVVTYFKEPRSYTTDDLVEISCHGGLYVQGKILKLCTRLGSRIAEPGEFTLRAFLGGRIDLSQAEAVGDLISAKVASAHRSSVARLKGLVGNQISPLRQDLIDLAGRLELELDFSEEELSPTHTSEIVERVGGVESRISDILDTYESGRIIREGALIPIVGKPNAGKSSLLNALLKTERAIVTPVAGTTRDTVEEEIEIDAYLIRLVDTAGVRGSEDPVEQLGVKRSLEQISAADLILWLIDRTTPVGDEDHAIKDLLRGKNYLVVESKCDLGPDADFKIDDLIKYYGLDGEGLSNIALGVLNRK